METSPNAAFLRRPETKVGELLPWISGVLGGESRARVLMTVETEVKYAGYIDQQRRQIERMQSSDSRAIPGSMEFVGIPGISREVGESWSGFARDVRFSGQILTSTPAAVALLDVYMSLAGRAG